MPEEERLREVPVLALLRALPRRPRVPSLLFFADDLRAVERLPDAPPVPRVVRPVDLRDELLRLDCFVAMVFLPDTLSMDVARLDADG